MAVKNTYPPEGLTILRERLMGSPPYVIIINAIHQRGEVQRIAMEVLKARGLWLTEEQKHQAAGVITNKEKVL